MTKRRITLPQQRIVFTGIGFLLGAMALLTPYWGVAEPAHYVGGLLIWAAILEIVHGFRRADNQSRMSAWVSGAITILIGTLMLNAQLFQRKPLIDFILALFIIEAIRYLFLFFRSRKKEKKSWDDLLSGILNGVVVLLIILFRDQGLDWVVSTCGALRIFGTVYGLYTARTGSVQKVAEDVVDSLGLRGNIELETLAAKLGEESERRAPIDAGWIVTFIMVLFFIHLGRMGFDQSVIGISSPLIAAIGDVFVALVFAFGFIAPIRTIFRRFTGLFIRALWKWVQKVPEAERRLFSFRTLARAWLVRELRVSISIRKSGYSFLVAARNGLKIGLPYAALLAAVMPVLGMSWYFDTENWASGAWDNYAGRGND